MIIYSSILSKMKKIIGEFAENKNSTFIITSTLYNKIDINSTNLDDQSLILGHNRVSHFYQRDISKYFELHNIKSNK
jgi:hypothetical protein